jgi:2-hydroxy-6-oxonona-2,4-dienedioate hydrolase
MNDITFASTSKTITVNEGPLKAFKVHFNDIGSGDAVVMLHGSGPGATGWGNFNRNMESFVQAGYRVLLIDQPGWGRSDPIVVDKGNRAPLNAAAIKGVLDALGIGRAHVLGNSMGGAAALLFAMDFPDRCGKLVIMGGGAGGQSLFVPMPAEGIKLLFGVYRQPTLENLKRMLNVFVFDSTSLTDELIQSRFNGMNEQSVHMSNFVKSMEINPKHLMGDFSGRLSEVKSKSLVVWGRDDRFVPLDAGLRLVWGLPDAQMHIFGRCGHWVQWEHADEFNRMAIDFLKQ